MPLREIRRRCLVAAHFVHARHTAFEPVLIFAELYMNLSFLHYLKT